jgi:hypothetical protein
MRLFFSGFFGGGLIRCEGGRKGRGERGFGSNWKVREGGECEPTGALQQDRQCGTRLGGIE